MERRAPTVPHLLSLDPLTPGSSAAPTLPAAQTSDLEALTRRTQEQKFWALGFP